MKELRLLFIAPLFLAFSCEDDLTIENDFLFDTGIYGSWEMSDQTINGISDMKAICCRFLSFSPDQDETDKRGEFMLKESDSNVDGFFILDRSDRTITFQRDGSEDIVYDYTISNDKNYLTLIYSEDGTVIQEGWRKQQ